MFAEKGVHPDPNAVLMLGQRRRSWADINPALGHSPVFVVIATLNLPPYRRLGAKGSYLPL